MRRQRLLTLTLVSFLLLCLTVICANASWFIQDKHKSDGTAGIFRESADTSNYFTTGPSAGGNYVFDAGQTDITPTLNSDGVALLGGTASDYTVTWEGCTLTNGTTNYEKSSYTSELEGVVAGTHYYKIVENATGQVISKKHAVTVEKRAVTVSTPATQGGFVGNTLTWNYNVYGVSSSGGNYSFDGNSASFSYSYDLKVSDYGTDGYTTSTTAFSATASIPVANTDGDTHTGNVVSKYSLSGSMKYGNYSIDHANNYYIPDTLTYSAAYAVLPTTYTTQNTTTFWATLTDAINGTTSGTIYPMQQVKYDFGTETTTDDKTYYVKVEGGATPNGSYVHEITTDCEIKSGVALTIPFGTDVSKVQELTYHIHIGDETTGACTSSCSHRPSAYNNNKTTWYTNAVTLKSGKTLTNNGTINVSGTVSSGAGGYNQNSITAGLHARIVMESGTKIDSYGTITCYGFINETAYDNGSEVTLNSGSNLTSVFSINEHRGGAAYMGSAVDDDDLAMLSAAVISKERYTPTLDCFPFARVYLQSVSSLVRIKYGASVYGYVNLYANNQHNETTVKLVGSSSDAFIQMASNSEITNQFNPSSLQHDLDIYGTIAMNNLQLNLDVTYEGLSVKIGMTSKGALFPVSYHWNVNFKLAKDNSTTEPNISAQYIKLLPGSVLTVDEGVALTAHTIAVYANDSLLNPDPNIVHAEKYNNSTPANLTVNGSLSAVNLGGTVKTTGKNGSVHISTSTSVRSREILSMEPARIEVAGKGVSFEENVLSTDSVDTLTANGPIATSETGFQNQPLDQNKLYNSFGNSAWFKPTATITLNANTPDGSGTFGDGTTQKIGTVAVTQANGTTSDEIKKMEKPGRDGYKFVGWYLDAACTTSPNLKNIKFDNTVTLYAKWEEAATISVSYSGTNNVSHTTTIAITEDLIIWEEETNRDNPGFDQYVEKWTAVWTFTLEDGTTITNAETPYTYTPGQEIKVSDVLTSLGISSADQLSTTPGANKVSLTAKWAKKHTFTVSIKDTYTLNLGLVKLTGKLQSYSITINGQNYATNGATYYAAPGATVAISVTARGAQVSYYLGTYWCAGHVQIGDDSIQDTETGNQAELSKNITATKDGTTQIKIWIAR